MGYRADWMSDDQWACVEMLAQVRRGHHHIYGKIKPWGNGIKCVHSDGWATFDFDQLTRLVVLAHDHMIRVEIKSANPGRIAICMWQRKTREGSMSSRHPTIEDAIQSIRPKVAA